jgi:hypothetical protein
MEVLSDEWRMRERVFLPGFVDGLSEPTTNRFCVTNAQEIL